MKANLFLVSVVIISFSIMSCSDKKVKGKNDGATFKFEKFEFSTKSLYNEIDQSSIKALKLSFRMLSDTSSANNFLFNPEIRENNRISLFNLLTWAIEEKNLIVYDFFSEYFTEPVKADVLSDRLKKCSEVMANIAGKSSVNELPDTTGSPQGVISYILMESTIYGKNGQIIAVRPIGLCPVLISYDDMSGRIIKRPLFWAYFPDLMVLLSNHSPEIKTERLKTTLDFFTTNSYSGRILKEYNSNSPLMEEKLYGDTTRYKEGFNVEWIYNQVKDGMYIDPYNKLFQGNGKQIQPQLADITAEPELNLKLIASAKYVENTLNLRDPENYPLYFPETPSMGQKSLIDVIYDGIKEGKFTAYSTLKTSAPLSVSDVETALGKETLNLRIQSSATKTSDTVISVDFNSSDVKKYIVKEIEFHDANGTIIGSRFAGIIPIREITNDLSGKTNYKPLFYIPFNNPEFRNILSGNYAYRFTADDNISYLSFLLNKKYKVESFETKPVSVSTALKECGIQQVK